MPIYSVNIKWGKEKFEGVQCNTDEPPLVFKATIFSLSGVQPDRQKIMIKGSVLKDDNWGNIKISDNVNLLMMGTADELPPAPIAKPVFVEDMTESQLAHALELPSGLNNLGNTCYLNATLQCLRSVPELRNVLKTFQTTSVAVDNTMQSDSLITSGIRDLFRSMESSASPVPPFMMLNVLHMCFPRFAEKSDHGGFQQQDANECWTELVRCLQRKLPAIGDELSRSSSEQGASASRGFVDQYLGGELEVTMKCQETEDEPESVSYEQFYQLSCFIEKEVKYMHTGLKAGLEGEIIKNSQTLGRDARYVKQSKIKRLPAYLSVQMVRFFYKGKEAINAKILKDIKFPLSLDVFDLCTKGLQEKLVPAREKFKQLEDERVEKAHAESEGGQTAQPKAAESSSSVAMGPFSFPDDVGSNNSGYYVLQAVLTHKGRSSSSGHYVAWVRGKKKDEWLMFDDDNVTPVTSEDILKLSGGGDWHCAYVLLYGPRVLGIE